MHIYILFLLFCANTFFYIGPWWHESGVFNIADIGNAAIWISLFLIPFTIRNPNKFKVIKNPISVLIVMYVLFVCIHVSLAAFYYGQSLFDGFVGVRHQFYYLSFFLFILLLDDIKKIRLLLDVLIFVSICLLFLAIINYFGPTIFDHKWAEGQNIRSGVTRAFIPGMSLISFSLLWAFTKWVSNFEKSKVGGTITILLVAAHLFRQTRMRLLGVVLVMAFLLVMRKKWKSLIACSALAVLTFLFLEVTMDENIVTQLFSSSFENVINKTGSWAPRLEQLELDLWEFRQHPYIGSGVSAIRSTSEQGGTQLQRKMLALSYKSDLGYSHWLKSYGLAGIIWLILFFCFQAVMGFKALAHLKGTGRTIAMFGLAYLGFVIISFITLNHLMFPWGIILLCLNSAIISRLYLYSQNTVTS